MEHSATLSRSALALAHVAVDARGGGHVEPLGGADEVGVVDFDEVAFVLVVEGGAGGAVGFVADDQVEVGQTVVVLGLADDVDGVVGGEHDAHVLGVVALVPFLRRGASASVVAG